MATLPRSALALVLVLAAATACVDLEPQDEHAEVEQAASGAARIQIINGKKTLMIHLRFVCSSWLFVKFPASEGSPDFVNAARCASYAAAQAAEAQQLFDHSQLPVRFTHSWEIEPAGYPKLLGRNLDIDENQRLANANAGRMPGLVVTDADVQAAMLPETCNPFLDSCAMGNLGTFQIACQYEGYRQYCDTMGRFHPPNNNACSQINTRVECYCNPIGTQKWIDGCPFRGSVAATSLVLPARNGCGCLIGWENNNPRPLAWSLDDPSHLAAAQWLMARYPVATGDWTITVAVKPFAAGELVGVARRLFDVQSRYYIDLTGVGTDLVTDRDTFFGTNGYVVMTYDAPALTFAHELGHVFSALHERASWQLPGFYVNAGFQTPSGTPVRPGGAHAVFTKQRRILPGIYVLYCDTDVMHTGRCPNPNNVIDLASYPTFRNTFSSPLDLPPYGVTGTAIDDNRRLVGNTINFLAGEILVP